MEVDVSERSENQGTGRGIVSSGLSGRLTWIDPLTGLEWQFRKAGPMSWTEALKYARSLELDGKKGWRLPSVRELDSLLDRSKYRPEVRAEVPFRDELSYWSSTTFEDNTANAWIIMFDGAYVLSYPKTNKYYVRCVRGKAATGAGDE